MKRSAPEGTRSILGRKTSSSLLHPKITVASMIYGSSLVTIKRVPLHIRGGFKFLISMKDMQTYSRWLQGIDELGGMINNLIWIRNRVYGFPTPGHALREWHWSHWLQRFWEPKWLFYIVNGGLYSVMQCLEKLHLEGPGGYLQLWICYQCQHLYEILLY